MSLIDGSISESSESSFRGCESSAGGNEARSFSGILRTAMKSFGENSVTGIMNRELTFADRHSLFHD